MILILNHSHMYLSLLIVNIWRVDWTWVFIVSVGKYTGGWWDWVYTIWWIGIVIFTIVKSWYRRGCTNIWIIAISSYGLIEVTVWLIYWKEVSLIEVYIIFLLILLMIKSLRLIVAKCWTIILIKGIRSWWQSYSYS